MPSSGWPILIHRCPICGWYEGPEDDRVRRGCDGWNPDAPHKLTQFDEIKVVPASELETTQAKLQEAEERAQRFRDYADSADRDQERTLGHG